MPFTFADLLAQLNPILYPVGEQENLVVAHRAMFVEALVDLQTWVECLQINNTQIVPACDTLFKCGYTVTDWPRGRINRIYTLDRINQTTGKEDATQPIDWCTLVDYRQVEYSELDRYISETLAKAWGGGLWGWCGLTFGALAGIFAFPDCWLSKYETYAPPDDAGLATAPPLPIGFHYQQPSTDAKFRAQWGMWAIRGGQIYVAPWIQSTEILVIEWDGIKRTWNDIDLVDPDPNLIKSVEWYVRWQQALKYDHDYAAADAAVAQYNEVRAVLMRECAQENEVRRSINSKARGAALVQTTYTNEPQTATAACPAGTTGNAVTVTVPSGTVVSAVSVADANAQAKSLALQQAGAQLVCVPVPVTYLSLTASATAQCQGGSVGQPVTVTIPAGSFTSIISQVDANTQAQNAANAQANAELACTFQSAAINRPVTCPQGQTGSCPNVVVPAGAYTSTLSQADADAQAQAQATVLANGEIAANCSGVNPVFKNTQQSVPVQYLCNFIRNGMPMQQLLTGNALVVAGLFSSLISQQDANNQAIVYGNAQGTLQLQQECQRSGGH